MDGVRYPVTDAGKPRPAEFSWARPATDLPPARGLRASLGRRFQDVSWFDAFVAVAVTAVFDLVVGLVVSAYYGTHCRSVCTLHQQAHEDRMLLLLIPLLLGLPPVLVALLLKRLRVLIASVQSVVCAALMIHAALDLRTVNSHIHGTAPCWAPEYPPKDCPWGPV
jgi:hypothetical protein